MVTPFGVTPRWLEAYLNALAEGCEDADARIAADDLNGVKGKEFARCRIKTAGNVKTGDEILCLTVPVEGGSSVLKRRGVDPRLSDHGKWRREHLGALNAAYGSTPYFEHLMPEIEKVYADSQGISLEEFNSRMLGVILGWIDRSVLISDDATLREAGKEVRKHIDADLSALDMLFRLGKTASLGLIAG